ncbi:glycyl radical protein [Chloroflexota bacterium]
MGNRISRLRDDIIHETPRLDTERLRCLKEAYKETEGQPEIIKRAKLFEKFLKKKTIFIDENPIVGTPTKYPLGLIPYPEISCRWMKEEAESYTCFGKASLSKQEKEALLESVDYWEDKCIEFLTDETWSQRYSDNKEGVSARYDDYSEAGVCSKTAKSPWGRINVDYGKAINQGLNAVITEAEEELKKLPLGSLEATRKGDFLRAAIISSRALIGLAQRYASLAREISEKETDPQRKRELEKIAEICQRVPAKPARTFYEGIQSLWFVHLALHLEQTVHGYSPGRFSQYMYPLYQKDRAEGKITEEEAIEFLEFLFLRFTAVAVFQHQAYFEAVSGNLFQNISLGGVNEDGDDASTELDYLLIEAQKRVQLFQPTLSLLYHDKIPHELLLKASELVKTGIGMPAFFNSDVNIQRWLNYGATLEEARNHCIIGCVETGISHRQNLMRALSVNMPKFLEFALNNGKDPLTGKQLGLQTGEAEAFKSYDELHEAVKKQLQYQVPLRYHHEQASHSFHAQFMPRPFASALVDDCIKNGKDLTEGGSRYSADGTVPVATIDLADSLAAIKKMVFEEKKISMKELLKALKADFEGYEEIHKMLLNAPKYGNNDDYVDSITKDWYRIYWEADQKHKDYLGRQARTVALSVTLHNLFGRRTGALPSGRKAGVALSDGSVSASPGMDRKGPTALIKSAARVLDTTRYASGLLNMKFHPSALHSKEQTNKLIALIKSYLDLGGHHVQFNVVSADTLKDAQLHPENYRSLIVRVAGFSALFVTLDRLVQDEIIKRTELTL